MIEKIDIRSPDWLMLRLNAFWIVVITGGSLNRFSGAASIAM